MLNLKKIWLKLKEKVPTNIYKIYLYNMELYKSNFDVFKTKSGHIIFRSSRKNQNIFETPRGFSKNISIITPDNNFTLKLEKVSLKINKIFFRFKPSNIQLPNKLSNTSLNIIPEKKNIPPKKNKKIIETKENIPEKPIEINTNSTPITKYRSFPRFSNPYIYTNVESGYSAKSFPYVYVKRYKYGPQGDKFQTTPQVAPA